MASDGGRVVLDLRPVSSLLPHEETIDSQTSELAAQLRKDGIQKDPLIVDQNSGVVLDGMHRLSALIKLGAKSAACSLVAYDSPRISVSRWARVYRASGGSDTRGMFEEVGLTKKLAKSEGTRVLQERKAPVAAFVGGYAYLPEAAGDISDGLTVVRKMDQLAHARGLERAFAREDEIDQHLNGDQETVLFVQRLEKRDVLEAGTARRPFPCKTSMHVVDPRPVAVRIPLSELETGSRTTLDSLVGRGHYVILPSDSVYEGRKYKERLLVLSTN